MRCFRLHNLPKMSAPSPMEIYVQNPQDADIADQNGVVTVDSTPSPIIPQDKVLVSGMYEAPFHHQFRPRACSNLGFCRWFSCKFVFFERKFPNDCGFQLKFASSRRAQLGLTMYGQLLRGVPFISLISVLLIGSYVLVEMTV